jgi:type IV secretion system protein VirD4
VININRKRKSPIKALFFILTAALVLYCAAVIGATLDKCKNDNGKINFSQFSDNFNSTTKDFPYIISHITNTKSSTFTATVAGGVILIFAALYFSNGMKMRKGEEYGSARWATKAEAAQLADKEKPKEFTAKNMSTADKKGNLQFAVFTTDKNILLTREVVMSLNTQQHRENLNVLVIGGSGSGKSLFFVKPNIMQMNTSYVCTDPKGELLRSTGTMLEANGYKVKVFNLIDMKNSFHYNPFAYVYSENKDGTKEINANYVIKMVDVFLRNTKEKNSGGDKFWEDCTKMLLTSMSFYLLEQNKNTASWAAVAKLLRYSKVKEDDDFKSELDLMFEEHEKIYPGSLAVMFYKDFKQAAGDTLKSILISCSSRIQAFNLPEVANLTHKDTLELEKLGDDKQALFIIIPASDTTFNFLAAMLYTQMFDKLYDRANFHFNGKLKSHVRCMFDEFANIGQIPEFDKLLATMRSMEISANIVIQNMAQLKAMYKDTYEIITGNCDSLLFLGGQEDSTLQMLSKRLGKETIYTQTYNYSKGKQSSTSKNNAMTGRELMTPDELGTMPMDECVLFVRAFRPFIGKKINTFSHRHFKYSGDGNDKFIYDLSKVQTEKMPDIIFDVPVPEDMNADVDEVGEVDTTVAVIPVQSDVLGSFGNDDDDEIVVTEGFFGGNAENNINSFSDGQTSEEKTGTRNSAKNVEEANEAEEAKGGEEQMINPADNLYDNEVSDNIIEEIDTGLFEQLSEIEILGGEQAVFADGDELIGDDEANGAYENAADTNDSLGNDGINGLEELADEATLD